MNKFCKNCGSPINENARFCKACGQPTENQEQKNKQVGNKKYAGFWIRVIAFLIDTVIFSILFFIILSFISGFDLATEQFTGNQSDSFANMFFGTSIVQSVIYLFYKVLMESSSYQGTIGKIIMDIKIIDENGKRMTIQGSIRRNILYIIQTISFIPFTGGIINIIIFFGNIMVAFTEKKQALHDMIANTFVIKK